MFESIKYLAASLRSVSCSALSASCRRLCIFSFRRLSTDPSACDTSFCLHSFFPLLGCSLLRVTQSFFFLSAQLRYFTLLSSLLCFSPLPSLSFPPPLFLFFFFFPAVSVSPGTVVIRNGSSLAENNKQHLFEVCDGCLTSPRCFMQILPPFVTGINKRLNLF